jgi:hypothetical protein
MWGLGLVGAAAAAALVVATTAAGPDGGRSGETGGGRTEVLSARTVLLSAAHGAARQPAATGRYWHAQNQQFTMFRTGPKSDRYTVTLKQRDESWNPRDGKDLSWSLSEYLGTKPASPADAAAWKRAGSPGTFIIAEPVPGSGKGKMLPGRPHAPQVSSSEPDPHGTYWLGRNVTMKDLDGLPADAAKLQAWLLRWYGGESTESGEPMDRDVWLFNVTRGLICDMPVRPAVRAAAFRMLADLDKVEVLQSIKDAQDRTGTAVAMTEHTKYGGVQQQRLIFDRSTGRALANDSVVVKPAGTMAGLAPGTVWLSSVVLEAGWVDRVPAFPGKQIVQPRRVPQRLN